MCPLGTLDAPSSIVLTQKTFKDKMGPVACPWKAFQNQDGSRTLLASIFLETLASLAPRTFPVGPSQSLMGKKRLESDMWRVQLALFILSLNVPAQ